WVNVAFDANNRIAFTADRNLYRYDPNEKSWKAKEGNLALTQFYNITPDPNNPDVMYGVGQDHPSAFKFTGTVEWAYVTAGGEFGKVVVDRSNSNRVYVSNPLVPNSFVARSIAGQAWQVIGIANDFAATDYNFAICTQKSFVADPSNPKRLLIGTTKVWEAA